MKIAFQGEPGANSHIAIAEAYPDAEHGNGPVITTFIFRVRNVPAAL